jgi:hypothetical protein
MLINNRLAQLVIALSLGVPLTFISGLTSAALAQYQEPDNSTYQSNEKDALYGDSVGGLNPLDLMHRAQQANGRSSEEFNEESQVQLNNSASEFKRLQQQRILEQRQKPAATPAESTENN